MKRIIYSSKAADTVHFDAVMEILTQSNRKNKELGITGMLVFDGVSFLQCIEGENSAVDHLQAKIFEDQRHTDIVMHGEEEITMRLFPQWNMGYVNREPAIRHVLEIITGSDQFNPKLLSYTQAQKILVELSYLI